MTSSVELLQAIDSSNAAKCVKLLDGLNEKSRRALYPDVAARMKELDSAIMLKNGGPCLQAYRKYEVAWLAFLGTATFGEIKNSGYRAYYGTSSGKNIVAVLSDRRPDWLREWADYALGHESGHWPIVRALIRGGLVVQPNRELYIVGMIGGLAPNEIQSDPALLDDELWALFEYEGSSEVSLAAHDKFAANSWLKAFSALSADGTIDRARLLQATLTALQRDFAPFRAGWFSRLHEALSPTAQERSALVERYLDLLNSRVPATVSFAMKALVEAHKAGALDVPTRAERLAPAFEARDKGTVSRVLTLTAKAARQASAEVQAQLAALAAKALGHESPEIQKAALAVVGDRRALIEPYLDVLAPSLRSQLGAHSPAEVAELPGKAAPAEVEPIASLTELVEAFAAVLENQGPPMEIERVIDGVARLGIAAALHDAEFPRATAALAKRAAAIHARGDDAGPRQALAELALAWARGQNFPAPKTGPTYDDFLKWRSWCESEQAAGRMERRELAFHWQSRAEARQSAPAPREALAELALAAESEQSYDKPRIEQTLADFLNWRLWCAAQQAAQRIAQSLLSLPTATSGIIKTAEFHRRWAALSSQQRLAAEQDCQSLFHLDFLLARLRAYGWEGEAQFEVSWNRNTWQTDGRTYSQCEPNLHTAGLPVPGCFAPVTLTAGKSSGSLEMNRWCATVSPRWREGWFAAGCRELGKNIDWYSAVWANRAYLEPLLDPHAPIGRMGVLLLALGLGAKDPGESSLATDALIAAIADQRLDATRLGSALAEASASGAIKFARWAKQFNLAAQIGPLHAAVIFAALEALWEQNQGLHAKDSGRLIELAFEVSHAADLRLTSAGARQALSQFKAAGTTRSAIAALLAPARQPATGSAPPRRQRRTA